MNSKQTIGAVAVSFVVMATWYVLFYIVWPPPPPQVRTVPTEPPATTQAAPAAPDTAPTAGPNVEATQPAAPATGLTVAAAEAPEGVELGSVQEKAPYRMQLVLDPTGAGVGRVVLNEFKQEVDKPDRYVFQQPYPNYEAESRPLATRSVTLNGKVVDLSNVNWELVKQSPGTGDAPASATYAVTISNERGPLARVEKTFTVFPKNGAGQKEKGQGYEVRVEYRIENLGDQPLKAKTTFNGTTLPPTEAIRPPDRQVVVGYPDKKALTVAQHFAESFEPGESATLQLLTDEEGRRMNWAGTSSIYFNAIVLPLPHTGSAGPVDYLEKVQAVGLGLREDQPIEDKKVVTVFETKELTIAPKASVTLPLDVYFGPKRRETLAQPYYTALPRAYYNTLVITSGFCAICTFDWLINGLVLLLGFFHSVFKDWGLAIICLVALVRTLLHPITKRSQVQMMKMGKFGPEIEKLRKKHGDNKEELNRAMIQFYKEHGFGAVPLLGCLPMFLQMPIWIALWSSLQSTFELRHEPFLYGLTWIDDLAKPDGLLRLEQPFDLFWGITISGLNILPLLLAVVFYMQAEIQGRLQPKGTPEQEQQKKMMKWMSLLFPVFLYSGPSGLNLYILTSTTIGIIESKIIRKHIKEREEAEKAGRVIVDAPATRASRRKDKDVAAEDEAKKKPTGLRGKLADLQNWVEDIRRDADRRGRDKA